MATDLEMLTSYITRQAILSEGALDNILANGINFKDWPNFRCRKTLEKFFIESSTNGYKYALWSATKSGDMDFLDDLLGATSYPSDAHTIKIEYTNLMSKERAEILGVQISTNPAKATDFISEFLNYQASGTEVVSFEDAVLRMHEAQKLARASGKQKVHIRNWPMLSDAINGFNPGRLGIMIADTGFGKTNLGVQLALDASMDFPTLYFNMEMIETDFTQRMVASMMKMRSKDFQQDWDPYKAELFAKERKLFYTTGKDLPLMDIQGLARSFKKKHGIEFIVVDYDQKIQLGGRDEEWRELQKASVALEAIAKELGCYVLLLAQSNLDGGISGSKRSAFPASNVFMFEKDDDSTIVRVTKNRFGKRNAAVKIKYDPEMAVVREEENYLWIDKKQKKEFKKSNVKTP